MAEKVKFTFLGTSAQIPTAKRNHTSMLLTYKGENILIDCGEGTQRQFRKMKLNPCKITRILLTHIHGDHTFGLPGLLATLSSSGYSRELFVYGPRGTKKFLSGFLGMKYLEKKFPLKIFEVQGKFFEDKEFFLEAKSMAHGIPCNAYSFVIKNKRRIDKKKLEKSKLPVGPLIEDLRKGKDVLHEGKKYKSKGFTYLEKGKKISFVLDTSMNSKIISFVKDSDLLIMESSFDSNLKQQAKEHLHLTAEQDGEIAKKSNSKKLILTHISERYENNVGILLNDAKKKFKNVSIANDFDVVEI